MPTIHLLWLSPFIISYPRYDFAALALQSDYSEVSFAKKHFPLRIPDVASRTMDLHNLRQVYEIKVPGYILSRSVGTCGDHWLKGQQQATPYGELRQLADEWNFK